MSLTFAKRLDAVSPSVTLAMNARAALMRQSGVDVFAFGVGEPDFEPPAHVLAAAKSAIDAGVSKYTAVSGIPQLRRAICEASTRSRGFTPRPEQVTVTVGVKHALFNLAIALYEPGDEIVIPAPCWVSYPEQVRMMGAEPVIVPTAESDGWRISADALEAAITPRTKAVLLCTPSNPTGAAYPEHELRALLEVLARHEVWLIVDEIYAELVYDGFQHVSVAHIAPDMLDRIVVVDGVSKTYAMTGWRLGWSISPPPLAKILDVVQGQSTTNATAVAQHAAVAALTGGLGEIEIIRARFQSRRDVMIHGLNAIPGISCRMPEGAFYAFADCRGLLGKLHEGKPLVTDEELAFWMLDVAHVAAVPGGPFSAPGYVRFSYATSEERIREGLASLAQAASALCSP